jgi:hypothetical protein
MGGWSNDNRDRIEWLGQIKCLDPTEKQDVVTLNYLQNNYSNLIDGTGASNQVAVFSDANTLTSNEDFTFKHDSKFLAQIQDQIYKIDNTGHHFESNNGNAGFWFKGDGSITTSGQIVIEGYTDPNQQMWFGYDTTGEFGMLQCIKQYTGWVPLYLSSYSRTLIGTTTDDLTNTLQVGGTINAAGDINTEMAFSCIGNVGYTGDLNDSANNKIADVVGGIIIAVYY